MTTAADVRFWAKVDASGDCWAWTAATAKGYGTFFDGQRMVPAHRFVWELLIGPIPAGYEIDHRCINRLCVNPAHLEPVTPRENNRRCHITKVRIGTTHCPADHIYTADNTRVSARGQRNCRQCSQDQMRRRNERRYPERTLQCPQCGDAIRSVAARIRWRHQVAA